ncbi:hypothetical protein JCM5353_005934 [Sporobolomyces roseus]
MTNCSFVSYLQFRNQGHITSEGGGTTTSSATFATIPPMMSPLDLSAATHHSHSLTSDCPFSPSTSSTSSSIGSDAASPHKRQRAHSPDSSNSYPSLASFAQEFGSSFPFFPQGGVLRIPSTEIDSVIASPQPTPLPVRSILCTSSSPTSSALDTPLSSPPPTRPVSRRSSTSKSVRFARCTNASVFPTHSTAEYDRSPIVPTCEAQSLELKRVCSAEGDKDEGGGWIKCVEREKAAAAQQAAAGRSESGGGSASPVINGLKARLPKHSPSMENPVEGVHGLIEGGFFVGEEREQLANSPLGTVVTGIPGVGVITEDIELEEEALELDDDMLVDDSAETGLDDYEEEEEEAEQVESVQIPETIVEETEYTSPHRSSSPASFSSSSSSSHQEDIELPPSSPNPSTSLHPYQQSSSASSTASSSTSSITHHSHLTRSDSASPEMSATTVDENSSDDERERVVKQEEKEKACALKKKQRFGLCSLGKYTRQDVFGTYDSLGGF